MNHRLKATLLFLVDPRSMIFAFAVFNIILIWKEAWWLAHSGIACVACPWYDPWSWFNEPSLLLVAAFFLRLNKLWSWVIALILSGYLLGYFIFLLLRFGGIMAGLRADWRAIRMFYPYFIGSWDSQCLLRLSFYAVPAYSWLAVSFAGKRYLARWIKPCS